MIALPLFCLLAFCQDVSPPIWKLEQQLTTNGTTISVRAITIANSRSGRLVLDTESPRILRTIGDLAGSVEIDTPQKALEFVRLQTSPATQALLKSSMIGEVMGRSTFASSIVYGNEVLADDFRRKPNGFYGIVDDKYLVGQPFQRPTVRAVNQVFEIVRMVLVDDLVKGVVVCRATEQVTQWGEYRLAELTAVKWKPSLDYMFQLEHPA